MVDVEKMYLGTFNYNLFMVSKSANCWTCLFWPVGFLGEDCGIKLVTVKERVLHVTLDVHVVLLQ